MSLLLGNAHVGKYFFKPIFFLEIPLGRPIEVCGKVLCEKNGQKLLGPKKKIVVFRHRRSKKLG